MTRLLRVCLPASLLLAALIVAALVALTEGGASSANTPVDRRDPEAVARAYYASLYACGEAGAGLRYDLSTSPGRDWSRAAYLQREQRDGCKPRRAPAVDVRLGERLPQVAVVLIVGPHITERLVLVLLDDGTWKVDTSVTDEPARAS